MVRWHILFQIYALIISDGNGDRIVIIVQQKPKRLQKSKFYTVFRLDALALSVIATATWLAGWLGGCLSQPVLYQND